jgi:hypothetical protein
MQKTKAALGAAIAFLKSANTILPTVIYVLELIYNNLD